MTRNFYAELTTPTTITSSPVKVNASSTTELSPDESITTEIPDNETTMWSVTQKNNETIEAIASTESSTEDNLSRFNETSSVSYENTTASSLEGVDFKTSKLNIF